MQCEHCKKRKATVFYRENINGKVKEFQLCNDCANAYQQAGELEDMSIRMGNYASPISLGDGDGLWTFWTMQPPQRTSTGKVCPLCGCTPEHIKATGRVGCEVCYATFAHELASSLRAVHGGATYVGRYPKSYRQKKEKQARIQALKEQLVAAVSAQAFEEAAKLRDEIRNLEGTV